MAESKRFELLVAFTTPPFQDGAFDRSASSPCGFHFLFALLLYSIFLELSLFFSVIIYVGDGKMTFLTILFYIYMIGSLVFTVLNIITGMITKKTFRMLLNFIWILLLGGVGIMTWLYFQGFVSTHYYGWFPEMQHITTGIKGGSKLASIVLYSNIAACAFFVLYAFILLIRLIRGVDRAVDKTAESINRGVDGIKSRFSKKEEKEEPVMQEAPAAEAEVVETAEVTSQEEN